MKQFILIFSLVIFSTSFIGTFNFAHSFAHDKYKEKLKKFKDKQKKIKKQKQSLDLATGNVSTKDEIKIGRNVISGLLGAAPLVQSKGLQQYVNKVGYWIALQSERPKLPWSFGVINSPNINAFAAPGGYIVITLGLYQLLENESQLASILAHEISHVIEKHHLEAISKSSKGEILGSLAVKATSDKHQKTMQKLVNSSVQIYANGLDKKYEYGADRRGIVLAARAGYDPYALLDVLTTLKSINQTDDTMGVFLHTHPPLGKRLSNLEKLMDHNMSAINIPQDNQRLIKTNQKIATE